MEEWLSRTSLLLGEETVQRFSRKRVLVVGVGGVGAYAAEMICRAGVGTMILIDADVVSLTNINRQLPALHTTIGRKKVEVLAERFLQINPKMNIKAESIYLKEENIFDLFENNSVDFVVDAIDTIAPKIALIEETIKRNIPIISAMGAGGKKDPSLIQLTDISKTYQCPLAKVVRKRLRDDGISKGLPVVFSPETVEKEVIIPTVCEPNKRSTVGTISYLPAMFGCYMASYVIQNL